MPGIDHQWYGWSMPADPAWLCVRSGHGPALCATAMLRCTLR